MASAAPARRNQRAIKSCARCRRRRIKCNLEYPNCSGCAQAGVPCMGLRPGTNQEQPRSLVRSLENDIARLEIDLARMKARIDTVSPGEPSTQETRRQLQQAIALEKDDATKAHPRRQRSFLFSLRLAIYLSPSPVPNLGLSTESVGYTSFNLGNSSPGCHLPSIPRKVVGIMLQNYFEVYMAQYPIFTETELLEACNRIYEGSEGSFDILVVNLTLAISAHTLIRYDEQRAIQSANGFWAAAISHIEDLCTNDPIKDIQTLLLLCHYGFVNPSAVNSIACSGIAMRTCIQFGLHQEEQQVPSGDTKGDDRRRIFWTCYAMDAQLHMIMGRYHELPASSISIPYPREHQPDESRAEKVATAHHMYQWRRFETELTIMTLFPDLARYHGLKESHIDEWLSGARTWATNWREEIDKYRFGGKVEFSELMFQFVMIRLHRITPQSLQPSKGMRQACITACVALVGEYAKNVQSGKLFYIFHACWHLFEAAIVLVESTHTGLNLAAEECSTFLTQPVAAGVSMAMHSVPDLMRKISSRQPEASRMMSSVVRLLDGAVTRIENWISGNPLEVSHLRDIAVIRHFLRRGKVCESEINEISPASEDMSIRPSISGSHDISMSDVFQVLQSGEPSQQITNYTAMSLNPHQRLSPRHLENPDSLDSRNFTFEPDGLFFLDSAGINLDDLFTAFHEGWDFR